jgi:thiol-disulfide isomerase/thioredoxin
MNKQTRNFIIFAVAVVIIVGVWAWRGVNSVASGKYDQFAQCLADKKVTMYGAYWCPHCQDQKRKFGDSWRLIPYVECTKEVNKCKEAKVDGYPTWIFPDGNVLKGEQSLEKLSEESGCPLPQETPKP